MKRLLFVLSILVLLVLLSSCRPEPKATAGNPRLSDIDFCRYKAFAVMKDSGGSKGIADGISVGVNRLFGLADDTIEKISIKDDKGIEWACDDIKSISKDFLLMGLSCAAEAGTNFKNYIVDRINDKVIDLSFLIGDVKSELKNFNIMATAEGLFATKEENAVRIDVENKTLVPLTNPETDGANGFYRDGKGNMIVLTKHDRLKLFPYNGAPIDYTSTQSGSFMYYGIRDKDPMCLIANPDSDIIICLREGNVYHVSSGSLISEELSIDNGVKLIYYSGICLNDESGTTVARRVVWYSAHGYVTIHDLSSGELVFKKYNAPANLATSYADKGKVAYFDEHLIYSTESGLYSLNLEEQTTETLVEGSLARWQMTTGGVIYTKYLSATDVETCFLNLATRETEKLSSSGVEVVSIASFVE